MSINKRFFKYVYANILGSIGVSAYILADTFFIAKAVGADGITALNLVLPIYGIIFAISSMIAVGSATRFSIEKAQKKENAKYYFGNALFFATAFALVFSIIGIFFPTEALRLLGADSCIIIIGKTYTRIFMTLAPFFAWNFVCNAFVRNDDDPSLAMIATFSSSIFNIIFDYVFMFPCKMGMSGAALATSLAPLVGVMICSIHFISKKNTLKIIIRPDTKKIVHSSKLGVSAFVAEISSAVVTMVFNYLLLGLVGNVAVAAYGIVANISLVGVAVFNGIAQGSQPLFSEAKGFSGQESINKLKKMTIINTVAFTITIIGIIWIFDDAIINAFNNENDIAMAKYAKSAIKIYFTGYIFASINIVGTSMLSAVDRAREAFFASVLRGFVLIISSAIVLSYFFGTTGVWLAYPVSEAITLLITMAGLRKI